VPWPIYADGKIVEVYFTTGMDDAMAERQAQGKADNIAKDHMKGKVHRGGPFPTSR
jgi:hypothetical protein